MSSSLLASVLALALAVNSQHLMAVESAPSFTQSGSFLVAHPDLHWRSLGIKAYQRHRPAEAMTAFRRAARYADKPSQAMIAQMLWNGDGVKANRIMAYVWADLAAERDYPSFVATRKRFWNELSADERDQTVAARQAVFDEYADAVAKPRQENAQRVERGKMTGSRTLSVGTLSMDQRMPDGGTAQVDARIFYADKYWKPEQYWEWQDSSWEKLPEGKVEVGPLEILPENGAAGRKP